MKAIKWIILLLILSVIGYFAWQFFSPYSKSDPLNAISSDAVFVAETDNLFDTWAKLTTNKAWVNLKNQPIFSKLTKGVSTLDTIIRSNQQLSEFIGHRKVYVAFQNIGNGKYDMAYIIDLRRLSQVMKIRDVMSGFENSSIHISKTDIDGTSIYSIDLKNNKQTFYCFFVDNLFVGSFSKNILTKSLQASKGASLGKDPFFREIMDKTSGSGIFRIYVNFSKMDDYLKSMLVTLDPDTKGFIKSMRYSGLTFDISTEGHMDCEGYTMINDSVNSTLKAIINAGKGKAAVADVLPAHFSNAVSLCFSKFTDYFDQMQETLDKTSYSYSNYQKEISTIEKYLGINVRDNLFSWIDDEVSMVQMEPMGLGKNNEFAVFLKTTHMEDAKENLEMISKRIKNRTPIRVEHIDYKGYPINYISVKGFFKMFLGKMFQKLETPYYTYVGDYVVLSNHPLVLEKIIDAQTEGKLITKDPLFSEFYSHFNNNSNALVLMKTDGFLKTLTYDMKPQSIRQLEDNKKNFLSYPYVGFQMSQDGKFFKTRFLAYYQNELIPSEPDDEMVTTDSLAVDSVKYMVKQWIKEVDDYVVADVKQELFQQTYPDGNKKVEMEIRDGFRNGKYREYYPDEKIKMKGEYKDDKKSGTWKFYNQEGDLIYKQSFKDGEPEE